jgi:hypothetical protein
LPQSVSLLRFNSRGASFGKRRDFALRAARFNTQRRLLVFSSVDKNVKVAHYAYGLGLPSGFYVRRTSAPAKKFATRIVLPRRVKTNEFLLSTVHKAVATVSIHRLFQVCLFLAHELLNLDQLKDE